MFNGGCSHLCLLSARRNKTKRYSCSCPGKIELLPDGRTCNTPGTESLPEIIKKKWLMLKILRIEWARKRTLHLRADIWSVDESIQTSETGFYCIGCYTSIIAPANRLWHWGGGGLFRTDRVRLQRQMVSQIYMNQIRQNDARPFSIALLQCLIIEHQML